MNFDLKTLVEKLNATSKKALEQAASLCMTQTHYNVELEHYFLKLMEEPNADIVRLLRYYEIKPENVARDFTVAMEKFKRGNSRTPALSQHILDLLQSAWMVSSLHLNSNIIRSGALFLAIYEHDVLRNIMTESCVSLIKVPRELLKRDIKEIIRGSVEDSQKGSTSLGGSSPSSAPEQYKGNGEASQIPNLDLYTIDLTALAKSGKIDPIQGRDSEIRQIIDILTRRRQNNPILTGEAGVGKTAVVEGFALRIANGDIPPILQNVAVRTLDLGLLQAGAGIKGEFENRLKNVISEVKNSPTPIILFIDEAHTMIGAGGAEGQNDAANLLKPALARGELRTIAATTWGEYKKYFEKDPALTRRFQVVKVDEPSEEKAVKMLRGVVDVLERHHGVRILDEAVHDAVKFSHRYITGRQLPDKAISVLDTACARVAISQNSMPPELEDTERQIQQIQIEVPILQREHLSNQQHTERISELQEELEKLKERRIELTQRWEKESSSVKKYLQLQKEIEDFASEHDGSLDNLSKTDLEAVELMSWEADRAKEELTIARNGETMISECVDSEIVAEVISGWTGIPVGKMVMDEIRALLNLQEKMCERVIGQNQALEAIAKRIQISGAGLTDPVKPMGVFLLVGPSGVGKTESAITLAEILFGGERNLITVNMSEYQESHTVSNLKGAPPGYVGYGKGGVLTESVRRNPYSVVLLDEVEKAHPDVMELFYQVFDKGYMEDGEGTPINFRNTIILLTSNVGTDTALQACADPDNLPDAETLIEYLRPELNAQFKPALLGRLVIVPFYPLSDEVMQNIVRLKLKKIQKRFEENRRAILTYTENIIEEIVRKCTTIDSGARAVDNILTNTLLPELSGGVLQRMAEGRHFSSVHISMNEDGTFACTYDGDGERAAPRKMDI